MRRRRNYHMTKQPKEKNPVNRKTVERGGGGVKVN